jgi:hypothetical protein
MRGSRSYWNSSEGRLYLSLRETAPVVIPANAGTQGNRTDLALGSRVRGNDDGDRPAHTRFTFQNSGPVYSSLPARLLRYAVGIWNCPSVIEGTCE